MDELLTHFSRLMSIRLAAGVYTTEDSIRYTFFAAATALAAAQPHEIVLELPHPAISKAELDTFIPSLYGRPTAIEFKYDRAIPSGAAVPKPQNAGELFKDLYRLSLFDHGPLTQRLLIYCTDQAMVTYFRNPANAHTSFFDLAMGNRLRIDHVYLAGRPPTFSRSLGAEFIVDVQSLLLERLPRNHELRVFSVVTVEIQTVVEGQSGPIE